MGEEGKEGGEGGRRTTFFVFSHPLLGGSLSGDRAGRTPHACTGETVVCAPRVKQCQHLISQISQ